jgi:hypothetical protein
MDSANKGEWPAFSVRQPWAELLISGRKSIEIRSWAPDYRGGIWLHAGIKRDPELDRHFGFEDLYRGGFIGSIHLMAIVPFTRERWHQWRAKHLDPGEYRDGMVAWIMDRPHRFPRPVPGSGQLGLFHPLPSTFDHLNRNDSEID